MSKVGFIILRHVKNETTNKYWIHCYNCIREHYPENIILIIDDNSNYNFVTNEPLYKTLLIHSEYHGRGELLPYYYYLYNKLFDTAVILHDSVFINKYIDISVDKYKIIWSFEHYWDIIEDETRMINVFNDVDLKNFYENKQLWKGCFGGMSIITHDYLTYINHKYDFSKLLEYVSNRSNRQAFERVIACLLQINKSNEPLLGDIHEYIDPYAGYNWEQLNFENKDVTKHLPITKIFTGR